MQNPLTMKTTLLSEEASKNRTELADKNWNNFVTIFCGLVVTYSIGGHRLSKFLLITILLGSFILFVELVSFVRASELFEYEISLTRDVVLWGRLVVIFFSNIVFSLLWIYTYSKTLSSEPISLIEEYWIICIGLAPLVVSLLYFFWISIGKTIKNNISSTSERKNR